MLALYPVTPPGGVPLVERASDLLDGLTRDGKPDWGLLHAEVAGDVGAAWPWDAPNLWVATRYGTGTLAKKSLGRCSRLEVATDTLALRLWLEDGLGCNPFPHMEGAERAARGRAGIAAPTLPPLVWHSFAVALEGHAHTNPWHVCGPTALGGAIEGLREMMGRWGTRLRLGRDLVYQAELIERTEVPQA